MHINCSNCADAVGITDKFCGSCGLKINIKDPKQQERSVILVTGFFISFLLFVVLSFIIVEETYSLVTEILIELVFVLLVLFFTFFDYKNVFRLYNFRKVTTKALLFCIVFPIITAGVIYFGTEWLSLWLFDFSYNVYADYVFYDNAFLWAFLFIAVLPPIVEELAFRGFLFNQLRVFANYKVTILATAVIFSLVHFSMISLLWIFPFGIVLGYLRHIYKTLWLGMIVHFIHNLLILLLDYYYFTGYVFYE